MLVRRLQTIVYGESGWGWRTEDTQEPTWDAIEAAIRRLDRFRYPFIRLFRGKEDAADTVPDFTVIGGEDVFGIDYLVGDTGYRFFDPSRADKEIVIWRSDQGAIFEEKYCCYSLPVVLQATRYSCEHGAPDPQPYLGCDIVASALDRSENPE